MIDPKTMGARWRAMIDRRRTTWIWAARGACALAILLIAAGGALYGWLRLSLPQTQGTQTLAGISAPVSIVRDTHGVVTIRAQTMTDAYFALGFVHAQDRLWQMDFMRRLGAGRLSEVAGPAALNTDKFFRTLGLARVAERNLATLSAEARGALDSYAAGVNAYLDHRSGPLPPQFSLLRYRPEPWRAADSLIWGRLMAFRLSGNWEDELMRARLASRLPPEMIADLWPGYPTDGPVVLGEGTKAELQPLFDKLADALPRAGRRGLSASNSWAVDGRLSASGHPVLANDPHLGLQSPSQWYLVRIETPELTLAGATAPGVPFHILGHNDAIAWGMTSAHGDTQDLFVERLDPSNPGRYLTPEGSAPFDQRNEVIKIRGRKTDQSLAVRQTRHGPVLSDIVPNPPADERHVLALADPALRGDDRTGEALYRLNRARDWNAFAAALADFHSPQQALIYADRAGTIGLYVPGRVPIRRTGQGVLPVPGWTGEYDWTGFVPFAALPHARNPESRRIVAANNRLVPSGYPYFLTHDWEAPFRAMRIEEMLAQAGRNGTVAFDVHRTMQNDDASVAVKLLLPRMIDALPPTSSVIVDRLRNWDGKMDRDRMEPLVYAAWLRALEKRLYGARLGPLFDAYWGSHPLFVLNALRKTPVWCDDPKTDAVETCATAVAAALRDALDDLSERLGSDTARWRWGTVHRAHFRHDMFGRIPLLGGRLHPSIATDGNDDTLNRASTRFTDPTDPYADIHGPTLRAIYDLGDLDNSLFIIAPGQSDHPLSPNFDDLALPWREGEYLTLPPPAENSGRVLTLVPFGNGHQSAD